MKLTLLGDVLYRKWRKRLSKTSERVRLYLGKRKDKLRSGSRKLWMKKR